MQNDSLKLNFPRHDGYLPGLDCLRGLAIILVIFHHTGLRFPNHVTDPVSDFLVHIGWSGVDIFFGISGYLICRILIEESTSVSNFLIKRIFRIIPLYALAVLTYVLVGQLTEAIKVENIWIAATLLTGWATALVPVDQIPYLITWSLSVEESAYLLFAGLSTLGRTRFLKALWFLVAFGLGLRLCLVTIGILEPQLVYYFPATRIDSIAIGGVIASCQLLTCRSKYQCAVLVSSTCLLLWWLRAFGQYSYWVATIGYTLLSFIAAIWVSFARHRTIFGNSILLVLAHIGRRSYFIYLFHVFTLGGLMVLIEKTNHHSFNIWVLCGAVVIFTLLLSEISWRWFEYPLIKAGRRVANRKYPEKYKVTSAIEVPLVKSK